MKTKNLGLLIAAGAVAVVATPSLANHAWSSYHWARSGAEVNVPVVDNTNSTWQGHVTTAMSDWNQSTVIQSPLSRANNGSACDFTQGTIQVCNDDYGSVGWLGIASITLAGGHISAGTTKLNDFYFNQPQYNNYSWRQLVTCQEIGHDYGLGHQNENFNTDVTTSCMEYTSLPQGNEGPDAHDYEMLLDIYAHTDGTGGGGPGKSGGKGKKLGTGNTPSDWGRPVKFDGQNRPNVFVRQEDGFVVVTHVTWAIGEGPKNNGHR